MLLRQTLVCMRRARVTIPQLSPTHTRARILKFCIDDDLNNNNPQQHQQQQQPYLECYDPLFVVECSPDLVTEGYRLYENHCPLMIVESQEVGVFKIRPDITLNEWYDVGHVLGEIDDGDDDDDGDDNEEWLWQAYSHEEKEEEEK
ncbi:MAG: hypothetical protein SGILL_006327 [Bacillariaceae sp.]